VSRRRLRQPRGSESVALAIADIELAEALLDENHAALKRLLSELSTVKVRLAAVARLLPEGV
jgi:hypothetical protein